MITSVQVAGAPIDPCHVVALATVLHGRRTFADGPTPSSATIQIVVPEGPMPTWQGGDTLTLATDAGQLFAGRITDQTLAHDQGGVFTLTGSGSLARLGVRVVGDAPWPQETATTRADRVLTLAGVPYQVDGTTDYQVLPRDVDAQPALTLLTDLAGTTGAAVFDTPAGDVVYQALFGRSRPVFPYRWQDFDPALTWAQFDPALTWDGDPPSIGQWPSPASEFPTVLPCTVVEWEPEWVTSETAIINHVRIGYSATDPQPYAETIDQASIDRHGRRYLYQGTVIAGPGDAAARAGHIITTQAAQRWALGDVTLTLTDLDPQLRADVLGLVCGDHVTLQGLPQPAPAIEWTGICEGWTYTMVQSGPTLVEQVTLNLSDPLHSLAVLRWDDYPALYTWDDHPGYLTWADLIATEVLEVAA